MRVALVLSGQPRFYQASYDHFHSKIVQKFNADVYFHTWWSKEMVGSHYWVKGRGRRRLIWSYDRLVRQEIPGDLLRLYKPKAYKFEGFNACSTGHQFYSQWQSKMVLNRSQIQYDLIIRSRFDILCTQEIPYVVDDNLWVPAACGHKHLVNDMFSFSNYGNFDKITDTYLNLHEYDNRGMEWAFTAQCMKEWIPVSEFASTPETFFLYRSKTARGL